MLLNPEKLWCSQWCSIHSEHLKNLDRVDMVSIPWRITTTGENLFLYYAHKRIDGVGYLLLFSFILSYVTFQQFNFSCQIIMEEIQENELINQVIKITTTGKVELDQGMLKPIKKACKWVLPVLKLSDSKI